MYYFSHVHGMIFKIVLSQCGWVFNGKSKFLTEVKSPRKEALLVTGTESLVQSDRTRQIYCYHGQIGMRFLTKFVIVSILWVIISPCQLLLIHPSLVLWTRLRPQLDAWYGLTDTSAPANHEFPSKLINIALVVVPLSGGDQQASS